MPIYITLLYGFSAATILTLSILVLLKDYKSKSNVSFFLFGFFVVSWIISLYLAIYFSAVNTDYSFIFARLTYGTSTVFPFFLPMFFYYFPQKSERIPKFILPALFVLALAAFYVTTFTPLVQVEQIVVDGVWVDDVFGPLQGGYVLYIVIQLLAGLIFAIYKTVKSAGIEKKKMIIASSGFFIFYVLGMTVNVILPALGILILQTEVAAFSLFFVIPTFYAIQKHRFFDFSTRSLLILKRILIISIFLLISQILSSLFQANWPNIHITVLSIIASIISIGISYHLYYFFPDFIGRSLREFQTRVSKIQSQAPYCETYSKLRDLVEHNFVRNLHIESARIYLIRKRKVDISIPIYLHNDFVQALEKYKNNPMVLDELEYEKFSFKKKSYLSEEMRKISAVVCLPLHAHKKLIGFLALGPKTQKEPYSQEEIAELSRLKPNIEVGFMNILLKKNLQEENSLMKNIIEKKTSKLKKQFDKIKNLLEQQSDFIAVTAHEFRTPLSIALFQLEDLFESYKNRPKINKDMKVIETALENLKDLTQKLFDVQKYDLDKVEVDLQKTSIDDFLLEIYNNVKISTKDSGAELKLINEFTKPIFLNLDKLQIRQVILNLLSNAFKFVPDKNGKITIQMTDDPKHVYIEIIDNGPGVSDSDKKRIFNKFQGKKDAKSETGIGLGLYICRKIIELHNGGISVEDAKGGGSVFKIQLPK